MPTDPPVIHIGDVLTTSPRLVAPGTVFTLFTLDSDNKLQVDNNSTFTNQAALSDLRDEYINQLLSNNIRVVNDGSDSSYEDTFAKPNYPFKLIIKLGKYDLNIYANDHSRDCDDAPYTFTGTEFTSTGLQAGDSITHVDLASTGASSTDAGTYPIVPSNATLTPSGAIDKYNIIYHNGTFTVSCCPWGSADTFPVKYQLDYGEQTNPSNAVNAPTKTVSHSWNKHTVLETDEVTNSVGDPFGFGSSGTATCHVKLERINSVTIKATVTLTDTGRHWESLTGDPQTKTATLNCGNFIAGLSHFDFFWTAQYFGGAPIGLVMSFHIGILKGP